MKSAFRVAPSCSSCSLFHSAPRPLHDMRYWFLLNEVLSTSDTSRISKLWLPTLLNRVSVSAVTTQYLLTSLSAANSIEVNSQFSQCMLILWPQAAPRMNLETLTDCFGASLIYMASFRPHKEEDNCIIRACLMITRSFRRTFSSSSNKKKVCIIFTSIVARPDLIVTGTFCIFAEVC